MAIPVLSDLNVAGNVRTGTTTLTANTNFDNLVIEGSAHTGITIFSGTSSDGAIYFGDATATDGQGQIKYLHGSNTMTFATNDGDASLTLNADQSATFAGNIDMTNAGSGNETLTIKSTTGGDPTIVFNSAAANRSGALNFQDNGTQTGQIIYKHNGDSMEFYTGGASSSAHLELSLNETTGATFRTNIKVTGSIERTVTIASLFNNIHTCTLVDNDNFSIVASNAANTIALVVASGDIGKSGIITITNPASVGSLSFVALPSYMLTPSGATINFVTSANAVSVISYYVLATDKVLCNYIGNFA